MPQLLMIGSPGKKAADWRREVCDECVLSPVYLPPRGAYALDDAEDDGQLTQVVCISCAIRRYGQKVVLSILVGQND